MGILREMGAAHHRKWYKSFPLAQSDAAASRHP
jgi:hypothetical protein